MNLACYSRLLPSTWPQVGHTGAAGGGNVLARLLWCKHTNEHRIGFTGASASDLCLFISLLLKKMASDEAATRSVSEKWKGWMGGRERSGICGEGWGASSLLTYVALSRQKAKKVRGCFGLMVTGNAQVMNCYIEWSSWVLHEASP